MDTIRFINHKPQLIRYAGSEKEEVTDTEVTTLIPHLNCYVELGDDTMFDDIWQLIAREGDHQLLGVIFSGALGNHSLEPFIKQYLREPTESAEPFDPDNHVEYLELRWSCNYDTFEGESTFNIDPEINGFGPYTYPDHKDGKSVEVKDRGARWSLSFTPINDYKQWGLKLNKELKVAHQNLDDRSNTELFCAQKDWTVYDMLWVIFYEISFLGTPSDQIREVAKLDQSMAEAKDALRDLKELDE